MIVRPDPKFRYAYAHSADVAKLGKLPGVEVLVRPDVPRGSIYLSVAPLERFDETEPPVR